MNELAVNRTFIRSLTTSTGLCRQLRCTVKMMSYKIANWGEFVSCDNGPQRAPIATSHWSPSSSSSLRMACFKLNFTFHPPPLLSSIHARNQEEYTHLSHGVRILSTWHVRSTSCFYFCPETRLFKVDFRGNKLFVPRRFFYHNEEWRCAFLAIIDLPRNNISCWCCWSGRVDKNSRAALQGTGGHHRVLLKILF